MTNIFNLENQNQEFIAASIQIQAEKLCLGNITHNSLIKIALNHNLAKETQKQQEYNVTTGQPLIEF